tara:strand:+ start:637 stop:831 length:195 start_codon:yes stop_codon:yes gene_type:complete
MGLRVAESVVVVLKRGNARGAKGWQSVRTRRRNNDCTQQRQNIMVNETKSYRSDITSISIDCVQ